MGRKGGRGFVSAVAPWTTERQKTVATRGRRQSLSYGRRSAKFAVASEEALADQAAGHLQQ